MNVVKIGKHKGRCVYVSDAKIDEVAKIFPYSYLRCLGGVCEIIRHHNYVEEKGENEIVFESFFGKVGIKRESPDAMWFVNWWGFNQMEDR